jgi:hypothetical protein
MEVSMQWVCSEDLRKLFIIFLYHIIDTVRQLIYEFCKTASAVAAPRSWRPWVPTEDIFACIIGHTFFLNMVSAEWCNLIFLSLCSRVELWQNLCGGFRLVTKQIPRPPRTQGCILQHHWTINDMRYMDACLQDCRSNFHHYFKHDKVNAAVIFQPTCMCVVTAFLNTRCWLWKIQGLDVLVFESWKCSRILNSPHQSNPVWWSLRVFNMTVGHSQQRSQRKVVNRNVETVGLVWQLQQLDCPPSPPPPPPLPPLPLQLLGQALAQTAAIREGVVGVLATTLHHPQQLHILSLAMFPLQLLQPQLATWWRTPLQAVQDQKRHLFILVDVIARLRTTNGAVLVVTETTRTSNCEYNWTLLLLAFIKFLKMLVILVISENDRNM